MNTVSKLTRLALTFTAIAAAASATPSLAVTTPSLSNLTEGQGSVTNSGNPAWDGLSELVLIPGAGLIGAPSTSTAIYLGFTGGTSVNVGNMVLYQTPRNGSTVLTVTEVTLNSSSSPVINLSSKSVCSVAPSPTSPCIVRLDTIGVSLSPLNDYYFAIYFTLDTANQTISGLGQSNARGALSGFNLYGDQTRIGVDGALPVFENTDAAPFFVAYVTNL